jgi:hypothetical protein
MKTIVICAGSEKPVFHELGMQTAVIAVDEEHR